MCLMHDNVSIRKKALNWVVNTAFYSTQAEVAIMVKLGVIVGLCGYLEEKWDNEMKNFGLEALY